MLLLLVLLQTPAPLAAPVADAPQAVQPMSLERAIRELERPRIRVPQELTEQATFRLEVRERLPPWTAGDVSPWPKGISRNHYEFLESVTPEEFRGATLHPCCFELISITRGVYRWIEASKRTRDEARARRVVEQALRDWHAANHKK
jgi:hypothetical protein